MKYLRAGESEVCSFRRRVENRPDAGWWSRSTKTRWWGSVQSKCSQTSRCPGHTVLRLCTATGVGLFVGNNSPPWGMPTWPSYVHFREGNPAAQRSGEDHPRFEGQQGVMLTKFFTLEEEFFCSTRRTTDEAYPCNLCISKKLFALVFQMDDI